MENIVLLSSMASGVCQALKTLDVNYKEITLIEAEKEMERGIVITSPYNNYSVFPDIISEPKYKRGTNYTPPKKKRK